MTRKNHFRSFIVEDAIVKFDKSNVSSPVDLSGTSLCGLFIPHGFKSTKITFQAAHATAKEDKDYVPVKDCGNEIFVNVGAGIYQPLNVDVFFGLQFIRLVTDKVEDCEVKLAARPK